ncbi:MAG: hypothetical protein ACLP5V_10860 [Candidatus Bathyarchaeia archaeon]
MVDRKTHTVLRGIRIPKQLNEILQKDADAENRTVSALVVSILAKYAEWDRYTQKFGFVTVPRSNYKHMIDAMDEQTYVAATIEAPSTFLEMIRFWYKRVDARIVCDFCARLSKYVETTRCEVEEKDGDYTITIEHDLGMKYSNHLQRVYETVIRDALRIDPKIEVTNNSVFIRFSDRSPKVNALPI